jgi:ADP-ribosylglycohydrolase
VKISDRICNSKDFIKLKGALYAHQYLHEADCLLPALKKFAGDSVVKNALTMHQHLDNALFLTAQPDAIRGCMLGGAVGDALGAPIEFMSKSSIQNKYGQEGVRDYVEFSDGTGAITDDTQMALFTAEGILRAAVRGEEKGICCPASVVNFAYLRWLKTQGYTPDAPEDFLNSGWLINEKQLFSCRAPGMTCLSALKQNTLHANNNSKGCGTVMRLAPVGLFFEPQQAYEYGCEFSAITHGHPTGITAGGAFAMLISYLRHGKPLDSALDLLETHLKTCADAAGTLAAIRKARTAETIAELGEGWVAEEALAVGIYCALHHQWDFKAGVLKAINITGDSDSTGTIAGHILGVLNGENAIPDKWCKNLREYAIVSQIADDLCIKSERNSDGHITEMWWNKYPGY